jgi:hypothetical protein
MGVLAIASVGLTGFARASAQLDPDLVAIEKKVVAAHPEIPGVAIEYAFRYLQDHASKIPNGDYVTVIDFGRPSTEERMHVIRMSDGSVLSYLVAHGMNSGDNYATAFSNIKNSEQSSLGIYVTGDEYTGAHGHSVLLDGMEATNSNARAREIVLHSAAYVSPDYIEANGRLGRSDGCTAVDDRFREEVVSMLEEGSVMYAYHSKFCDANGCRY